MKLTKKEIQHIADLARFELTNEEIELYKDQLSDILNYVDQLQEVDVLGVEPTAQVTGVSNVFREDEVVSWKEDEVEIAINEAPQIEKGQYKVKKVL